MSTERINNQNSHSVRSSMARTESGIKTSNTFHPRSHHQHVRISQCPNRWGSTTFFFEYCCNTLPETRRLSKWPFTLVLHVHYLDFNQDPMPLCASSADEVLLNVLACLRAHVKSRCDMIKRLISESSHSTEARYSMVRRVRWEK